MAIPSGLPERLVEIRERNGYTRKRLAEELGRPYRTLTNYEMGEREPGHTYIIEIAKKFNVTADYLLGLSDDPRKTSDEIKKPPSMAKTELGDNHISLEESDRLLVALGLIKEGQQLSDDDLVFLTHVVGLLDAWFGKN